MSRLHREQREDERSKKEREKKKRKDEANLRNTRWQL
jgi:hypothetical protein